MPGMNVAQQRAHRALLAMPCRQVRAEVRDGVWTFSAVGGHREPTPAMLIAFGRRPLYDLFTAASLRALEARGLARRIEAKTHGAGVYEAVLGGGP